MITTDMDERAARAQYIASLPRRKVPAGCGQLGRHDEREWRMQFEDTVPVHSQAAEACTDIGANDTAPQAAAVFWTAYLAVLIVGVIAAVSSLL